MQQIMVVEDEEALCTLLRYNLEAEGYGVSICMNGDEVKQQINEKQPDLLILDWMLPGQSGIELCRQLRKRPELDNMPIIMLTARGEESERIRGLSTGADDYVVKPFSVPELMERIKAILRRVTPEENSNVIVVGDIEVNQDSHRVKRAGEELHLGPTEFQLLLCLMKSPGRVYSRQQLLDKVWGTGIFVEDRTVDVHVRRLRKVLNKANAKDPIRTVRGTGYAFNELFGN